MPNFGVKIALREELVLAREPGQAGILPGANLLGAAAAVLYRELAREEAWWLFHSGQLRFGNGLPLGPDGEPGWPLPACWRLERNPAPFGREGWIRPDLIRNAAHEACPLSFPEGHVSRAGRCFRPASRVRRPLGRDSAGVRAERSAVLAAQQEFLAEIAWDEEVPPALVERLRRFFAEQPSLLLGRARSGNYGRSDCRVVPAPALPSSTPPAHTEIRLWLLSDLAACDRYGLPTLQPEPEDLGLPPGESVPEKTFVRVRRYAPYNAYHRLYGQERQVIAEGSVLAYRLRRIPDAEEWHALTRRLEQGMGLYRESGLGRCVAEPDLLAGAPPRFDPATALAPTAPAQAPDHPLARWLSASAAAGSESHGAKQWAEQALQELATLERNARRLSGYGEHQAAAPSKQHWGRLAEAAERAGYGQDGWEGLRSALFTGPNSACGGPSGEWGLNTADQGGNRFTFAEWLERKLAERREDAPRALGLLAGLVLRRSGGRK